MRIALIVTVVLLAGSAAAQPDRCRIGWAFPDGRGCLWDSPPIKVIPETDGIFVRVGVEDFPFWEPIRCPNWGVSANENRINHSRGNALSCQSGNAVYVQIDGERALSLRYDGAGWRIETAPGPLQ